MGTTTKAWSEVLQGFFSREFLMNAGAFVLGGLLLYRNESSEVGLILAGGAVANYGGIRTAQKLSEIKAKKEVALANGKPPAPPVSPAS